MFRVKRDLGTRVFKRVITMFTHFNKSSALDRVGDLDVLATDPRLPLLLSGDSPPEVVTPRERTLSLNGARSMGPLLVAVKIEIDARFTINFSIRWPSLRIWGCLRGCFCSLDFELAPCREDHRRALQPSITRIHI
eukprot:GEMP01124799.1.p1 GENE.GEMP01124799.1~~GEMP01124799.1.p1  ORF type:complete len:136 (-),score=6.06 GEMP01124799.1:72-479(-)